MRQAYRRSYRADSLRAAAKHVGISLAPIAAFADWNEALGAAVQLYNARAMPKSDGSWDRRDEPTWHDKNVLMKACAAIG